MKTVPEPSPRAQLDDFLDRFAPQVAKTARAVLAKMRKNLPGAVELVYDNYNALAIGFGPSEKTSLCVFSVAVYPRYPSLFFFRCLPLDDPHKLLRGSGKMTRHIVINDAALLDTPAVKALIAQALKKSGNPFLAKARRRIVIKSISKKQRPRR